MDVLAYIIGALTIIIGAILGAIIALTGKEIGANKTPFESQDTDDEEYE